MKRSVYLALAGVVAVGATGAAFAVVATSANSQKIDARVVGFTRTAPYKVTFEVDKPPADRVICEVALITYDYKEAGDIKGIPVLPSKQRTQQLQVTFPANTGTFNQPQVVECVRSN